MATLRTIAEEKNLSPESVLETIEAALAAAYRKDFGEPHHNLRAKLDTVSGKIQVFDVKTVVEDVDLEREQQEWEAYREKLASLGFAVPAAGPEGTVAAAPPPQGIPVTPETLAEHGLEQFKRFDPRKEVMVTEAQALKPGVAVGEEIWTELPIPGDFGRMAAQTAKQVIMQRLREAERDTVYREFKEREGTIVIGTVQRREGRLVLVDLGRTTAIVPPDEQVDRESYVPGSRIKAYVVKVDLGPRGIDIVLSRSHPNLVKQLFAMEVPEVAAGTVEIRAIAREAGSRTKVAVSTSHEHLDPVGSCVGQRGARVQTVIAELGGEKVDVVQYSDDPAKLISNALSPAKVVAVQVDETMRLATVKVKEDQLSLAIGRGGQNVRLVAKLTGYKIDIVSDTGQTVSSEDTVDEAGNVVAAPAEAPAAAEVAEPTEEPAAAETEPAAEPSPETPPAAEQPTH